MISLDRLERGTRKGSSRGCTQRLFSCVPNEQSEYAIIASLGNRQTLETYLRRFLDRRVTGASSVSTVSGYVIPGIEIEDPDSYRSSV